MANEVLYIKNQLISNLQKIIAQKAQQFPKGSMIAIKLHMGE